MQCDDLDLEIPAAPKLPDLNTSLSELGMLSKCQTRQEYLHEIYEREFQNKQNCRLKMLSINSRYVSNVSIGFRVRPIAPHVRYKPYTMPKKEERHRTRSENNDNLESASIAKTVLDASLDNACFDVIQVKKAKSLESIVLENNKDLDDLGHVNFKIPDVEIVSNCIERLQVNE